MIIWLKYAWWVLIIQGDHLWIPHNVSFNVSFIMYDILQSEEFKIELNTNSSSDSRNPEKIPHFESF